MPANRSSLYVRHTQALLHQLVQFGQDLAREMRPEARLVLVDDTVRPLGICDLAEAFERIARAICRAILLDRKIDEARQARRRGIRPADLALFEDEDDSAFFKQPLNAMLIEIGRDLGHAADLLGPPLQPRTAPEAIIDMCTRLVTDPTSATILPYRPKIR